MAQTTGILNLLQAAHSASKTINRLSNEARVNLTLSISNSILENIGEILEANAVDLAGVSPENPLSDRLKLTPERLMALAAATRQVASLPDPVGIILSRYRPENGLEIDKVTVPIGVVGAIYEARPNVTVDIAALCMRSGNAVVLKGGSDAQHSNKCLVHLMQKVITTAGLPAEIITLLPPQREVVNELLTASRYVDVIIPRGSQALIDYVRKYSTVPTIETGAGVCHTYVHEKANLTQAAAIVVNAKTQRPSVCNALDTILIDKKIASDFLPLLIPGFTPFNEGIYADDEAYEILENIGYPNLHKASPEDYGREYLSQNCSVKVVNGLEEALNHIANFSSKHSEAIVTTDTEIAETYLKEVDAAAVYHNASTRFTDGGEFGLGAELGISTQKLHARGPFALEKLVCEKWIIRGSGQTR